MPRGLVALLLSLGWQAHAQVLLENGDLKGWTEQSFDGLVTYQSVQVQGVGTVLEGTAQAAASGYGLERRFQVVPETLLSWRWRVLELPEVGATEKTKATDDFPARVYVIRKGAFGLLSTQSLVYVWSQTSPPESLWDSPYTSRVKMLAVQPEDGSQDWSQVERNLFADWERAFGKKLDHLDGVALMVDSDNTQSRSRAQFERIWLD